MFVATRMNMVSMTKMMLLRRILISGASIRDGETSVLTDLFEVGLQRLHLRKPDSNASEVSAILSKIPEAYHNRIVLHRYFDLLKEFSLGGYHYFSGEEPKDVNGTQSRSLHKLDELKNIGGGLDYCFFGPVYESISKKGYVPKVSLPELGGVLYNFKKGKSKKPLIYALGGVRRRKVPELFNLGFDGVTLLGSIWGKKDPVAAFERYQFIERSVWAKKEKEKGFIQRLLAKDET
ncbi:MAG: thiamine phosphate synthase [Opitutae bacterium]|nr:thiamine phosphate synthase [Opitutae bacterium]